MIHTGIEQDELSDVLLKYRGGTAYWLPLLDERGNDIGNNGDALIERGSRKFCREAGLTDTTSPESADVLLVRGGGRMAGYRRAYELISRLWNDYPDVPLVLLPSSFYFPEGDFAKSLAPRSAPTHIFCREKISIEHITPQLPDYVKVGNGHDMAFCLSPEDLGGRQDSHHFLAVERNDYEHPSNDLNQSRPAQSRTSRIKADIAHRLPNPMARRLRNRLRPEPVSSDFRLFVQNLTKEHSSDFPIKYGDVSNQRRYSQNDFYDLVKTSELTITTRLHVGILSALLDIDTKVIAGPYHKLRGIHAQSMSDMEHVELVEGIW